MFVVQQGLATRQVQIDLMLLSLGSEVSTFEIEVSHSSLSRMIQLLSLIFFGTNFTNFMYLRSDMTGDKLSYQQSTSALLSFLLLAKANTGDQPHIGGGPSQQRRQHGA